MFFKLSDVVRCFVHVVMIAKFNDGLNFKTFIFRDSKVLICWDKWQTLLLSTTGLTNILHVKQIRLKNE